MKELFLCLFGFVFVYAGIKAIKKNRHLKKVGIRTIGTVISTIDRVIGKWNKVNEMKG